MITIISPAKNMNKELALTSPMSVPSFLADSKEIYEKLLSYHPLELASLMKIKESMAVNVYDMLREFSFDGNGTAAIETYNGLQYKYMTPHDFSESQKQFAQNHICILSGLYGCLKAYDSIYPYRLEMQSKLFVSGFSDLYKYWGNKLYLYLRSQNSNEPLTIINLASDEYSKCISSHLCPEDYFITCHFQVFHKGKWKVQATAAKMARGEMVHYIVANQINSPDLIKSFSSSGWEYCPEASDFNNYVFRQTNF